MNIKFGKHTTETVYNDGKPVLETELFNISEVVNSDSEELAQFINFQKEHKNTKRLTFERKINDKGVRYVIKTWVD